MRLRDRAFERRVRHRIRAALAVSPTLRREVKRLGRKRQHLPSNVGRLLIGLWLGAAIVRMGTAQGPQEALVVFAVGVSLLEAILLAGLLPATLLDRSALGVLTQAPVPDTAIFQTQWRRYMGVCLGTVTDLTIMYLAMGLLGEFSWGGCCLSLLFGILHGAGAVALGILIGVYRWHPAYQGVGCVGILLLFLLTAAADQLVPLVAHALPFVAPVLFCLPPVGWFAAAYYFGIGQGSLIGLALVGPGIAFTALAGFAYRRVKRNYVLREAFFPQGSSVSAGEVAPEDTATTPALSEAQNTELRTALRSDLVWLQHGPIEHQVHRWLEPRERHVAAMLLAQPPGWTRLWRRAMTFALLGVLCAVMLPSPLGVWGCWMLTTISSISGLPMLGGRWPGLTPVGSFGAQAPMISIYPLGFREITRVILKANTVRCLAYLPQAILLGACVGWLHEFSWLSGVIGGIKLLIVVWLTQPTLLIFPFAQGATQFRWRSFAAALVVVLSEVINAGLCVFALVVATTGPAFGSLAVAGVLSLATRAFYAICYNRNVFDLLRANAQ